MYIEGLFWTCSNVSNMNTNVRLTFYRNLFIAVWKDHYPLIMSIARYLH